MKAEIEERQYKRFVVLHALYKETKGSTNKAVILKQLAADNNIKNGVFEEVYDYLKTEGFIKANAAGIFITHEGKKAIEYSVNYPDERTTQFPAFKDMGI